MVGVKSGYEYAKARLEDFFSSMTMEELQDVYVAYMQIAFQYKNAHACGISRYAREIYQRKLLTNKKQ